MYICIAVLIVSNLAFAGLGLYYFLMSRALKERFKSEPSYDCQQLLADLFSGGAVVKIERLPKENLFFRRN